MSLVNAVVTDKAREEWPKQFGGLVPFQAISYFRVSEGGWENPGAGRQRRIPDKSFLNMDLVLDPARPIISRRYFGFESFGYFQKALTPGDFVYEGPTTLKVRCLLDFNDYNTKNAVGTTLIYNVGGLGVSPEVWELGLFDANNSMVAYGTFPKEIKNVSKQIENSVRIVF